MRKKPRPSGQLARPAAPITPAALAAGAAVAVSTTVGTSDILTFTRSVGGKSAIVDVTLTRTNTPLGTIRWDVRWSQYVFFPPPRARYNIRCLTEILAQLRALMLEWETAHGGNKSLRNRPLA